MYKSKYLLFSLILFFSALSIGATDIEQTPARLEILFLGHKAKNHDSGRLAEILTAEYFRSGINITYTTDPNVLNEETLKPYDGLIVYANHDNITESQEKALLGFVKQGKGFIALHSASFCFRNSDEVVEMIGGQFKSHRYGPFQAIIVKPEHPVMKGVPEFITSDETYVHTKISKNIEVLSERAEGNHREPYTWVRPYGQGRVFYTAYGHDEKTFNNPGFLKLVENGILWAVGDQAKARLASFKIANPKYFDGMVPNYEKRDPAPKVQEILTPEESMTLMQVPVGFELQLFASEPMIKNPIYMNWDERGRLWVIETVDYPNEIKDGDQGDDRIKILEDTDGDGKADKVTVFADKLNIPTSFVFSDDGIIVSQSPSFLFLKDTNGDDIADIRQEFIKGWGKNDTHAQASNLRYGVDNSIWGVVGYSGFNGVVGNDTLRFSNALYRFSRNGKKLEHISNASNNTWGLGFTEDFDVFISTANNTHTAFLGMPKRYFDKVGITENGIEKLDSHYGMHVGFKNLRQVDVHGGFTAAAGHSFYTARTYPKEYWKNVAFVTEPTGALVHKVNIEKNGSGFKEGEDGWNILASGDEWAAPVQAEVGPDGSLWIADWYNFIIQHNPTPNAASSGIDALNGKGNAYVNPLRDSSHGRIYRLAYKGNDQKNNLSLNKKDTKGLIAALSSDNMFWRLTAQRLLVEKNDKSVLPALYKIIETSKADEIGVNAPAIHALWTLHGLGSLDGKNKKALAVAIKALTNSSAGVRKAAIEVLPKDITSFRAMTKANVFNDTDYRVRLAALLATADMKPATEIGAQLVNVAEKEENLEDAWIKHALTIASNIHEKGFRATALQRGMKDDATLSQATIVQRLIFGTRLSATPLRRAFGRGPQQAILPNPSMKGNEFLFSGEIEKRTGGPAQMSGDLAGVIVTQGNKENGYSLYINEGKLHLQVNQEGKEYKTSSSKTVPDKFGFKAGLDRDGFARIFVDNNEVGSVKVPSLFNVELPSGMRVGMDNFKDNERVVAYPDSLFMLRGNIANGKLEILKSENSSTGGSSFRDDEVEKTIVLNILKDVMKFEKEALTAKAGSVLRIVVKNPDFMQHNFVLIEPKTSDKVGAAADDLAREGDGALIHYVPKMPEVIAATPLINQGDEFTLTFRVPETPGDYPYLCTFPGHWRIMNGVLKVTK
jgi:putative membrane-bound dehydrogenase-like protein